MRTRLLPTFALLAAVCSSACGPAADPATPPPAASAPAIVSVAPPAPPPASAPVASASAAPRPPAPPAEPEDLASEEDMQDLNGSPVHLRVPVGKSPVDGKPTALVTVIMFGGYQDPFSYRSLAALSELQKKYGDDLRLVWKDHPLPFHEVAIPLLLAAQYARQQRGDTGFWQAFHVIFQQHERLSKANAAIAKANQSLIAAGKPSKPIVRFDAKAFGDIARSLKISAARQKEMLATKDKPASIADDLELAHLVRIQGTPTFFINGRRLVGAQPLESFTKVIDEELIVAREQVASGVSRDKVYETLQARALRPRPRAERPTPDPAGAGMGPPTP